MTLMRLREKTGGLDRNNLRAGMGLVWLASCGGSSSSSGGGGIRRTKRLYGGTRGQRHRMRSAWIPIPAI